MGAGLVAVRMRLEGAPDHRSFMTSLNIPSGKESEDLPYLYWIPKLHKTPYKERYIAGSSTCSTKELSIHLKDSVCSKGGTTEIL